MTKEQKIKELEKAGAKLPKRVIERELKKKLIPWLDREEIIVVTGARQTGKSVLLYQLIYDFVLQRTTNVHYFNLDVSNQLNFIRESNNVVDLINNSRGKSYIFIDEVQRLKEPGLFLKGLYDLHLNAKIIVSGSSALEIKSKIHEPLTGRKVLFHVFPFNLQELGTAMFPGKNFSQISQNKRHLETVLNHFLTFGGYPAVAMAEKEEIKLELLKEIFQSYLDKDVKSLLKVENKNAFYNLVKILASQIGNLINKDELSNSLGIHKNTLDNYLFYLEETFILDFVRPFYKNPRKELLKSPKVYFLDPGIRNFATNSFSDFEFRPDKGSLFENFVYLCLKEKLEAFSSIYFWRTKAGAEVDFVKLRGLEPPIPYEAKATKLKEFKISKSLRSFLETYNPPKAYYVNLSLKGSCSIKKTAVEFLTPLELLKL